MNSGGRLGQNEKNFLLALYLFEYKEKDYSIERLNETIQSIDKGRRTVFSRILKQLQTKKYIFVLNHDQITPEHESEDTLRLFGYGKGIYHKLIGVTEKGRMRAEKIYKKIKRREEKCD